MRYILLDEKQQENIVIKGELFKYLIKVRRHQIGDEIALRYKENMSVLYRYILKNIENKKASLQLLSSEVYEVKSQKNLHIGWCIIDPKSIEKMLPSLNEIGVAKISFISCDRSQNNFKIDTKRLQRILEASMQQCGRSEYMEFDFYKNIKEFIKAYPDTKVFDFCDNVLEDVSDFQTILIGCEGGFSKEEKEFLSSLDVFRLDTPMVLRSESAVMAVASKILV
ncbi:Ribosomal RNA small subunit methyltransferase E [hydrothermal vent metagenome]|uniref:16S rRNA (uracil(1498)-N(3))-methyltransferase n=1 Tax=hydrothermal vent metagenome TaxID=652676 RepID=A0A1W1D1N2_9ZZZZ